MEVPEDSTAAWRVARLSISYHRTSSTSSLPVYFLCSHVPLLPIPASSSSSVACFLSLPLSLVFHVDT